MELSGRRVMVTGASRGIGEAIAVAFAAAGAGVVLVARSREPLEQLAKRLGGVAVPADLAEPEQIVGLVEDVECLHGPVDVLVNNAGVGRPGPYATYPHDELERLFQVNLLAPARLTRDLLPRMLERGRGHVVNVSSLAAAVTAPGLAPYCSSKAGLSHLTAALRHELRGTPVGTTLVEIGTTVPSELLAEVMAPDAYAPTREAFERLYRLRLTVDVPREQVADAIVGAVRRNREHVVLPRRAFGVGALPEIPRRVTELLLRR